MPEETAVDPDLAGRSGKPYSMTVEVGKVREFARAVKSTNDAYVGDAPIAPATFLITSGFWALPENSAWGTDVKLNLARIVHGEQEFVFHGPPPRAGDRLTVQARVERIYEKEGKRGGLMQFAEIVTDYRDADSGRLRAEAFFTMIETGQSIGTDSSGGSQ